MMRALRSIVLAVSTALAMPAMAEEFRLLSSWDQTYPHHPLLLTPLIEGIEQATEGRIKITVSGPETVPAFEQLEPAGSGVFDLLYTHGAYHFGTIPLMMTVEALVGDQEAVRNSEVFEVLDQHYQRLGLKLIMLPLTREGAYHIFLREPVNSEGDLKGRKIRGSLTYKGVIDMLGGVLTVLPAAEIYTGLEKGVIDGAAQPIVGILNYRWHEVAGYLLRPGFGVNYEPVFMNLARWNSLTDRDRKAILDVARQVEDDWYEKSAELWAREEAVLVGQYGMKITEMGEAQKAKLRQVWSDELWSLAASKDAAATELLRGAAERAGLLR